MPNVLNSPEYIALRHALIQAREAAGLTQVQVAQRIGRAQSFVSKYELGERRLDVVEYVRVCACLNVKPEEILKKIK